MEKGIQDYYPQEYSHCFGCGYSNVEGYQIKSYPDGEGTVCHYRPHPKYSGGFPGNIYGGLIASLMDCHAAATAAWAKHKELGLDMEKIPLHRFVTASLKVDYLKPTPSESTLELRASITEIKGRKVYVAVTLGADGEIKAKGEALMIQLPEDK